MHVKTAHTQGNPNIGLYAYATDKYCILGPEAWNLKGDIERVLKVPVIMTTIAGTSLPGVFLAGNSKHLLVPGIAFDHEIEKLKKAGIDVKVFNTINTALGNNMIVNDHSCLVGPMFGTKEQEDLSRLLGIPVKQLSVADVEVVGSCSAINDKGGLIHRDARRFEQDMIMDSLEIPKLLPGTTNLGVPYVRSGIIANTNGFLIGAASGGPEIANADEALGFIEG